MDYISPAILRELSAAASPEPWWPGHLNEKDEGCDCTYVLNAHQMGDVATFAVRKPGDEFEVEYPTKTQCIANMALTVSLRNNAERIADLVDAVAAYRAAVETTKAYDTEEAHADGSVNLRLFDAEEKTYNAMIAAFVALTDPRPAPDKP